MVFVTVKKRGSDLLKIASQEVWATHISRVASDTRRGREFHYNGSTSGRSIFLEWIRKTEVSRRQLAAVAQETL